MNKKNAQAKKAVLVTGAGGYIGRLAVKELARHKDAIGTIVATDVREIPESERISGVVYAVADVRTEDIPSLVTEHRIDTVVHLASIVTPGKDSDREFEHSVDVLGTENVLKACVAGSVKKIIISSSGAAYGYYADNSEWLTEDDPIRGNPEFAYSDHKRLVEQMLERYREDHPQLAQLILRPGTVLGKTTANQITNLFEQRAVIGLSGSDAPFVFIWDEDVAAIIAEGILKDKTGIYNLAGDGAVTMPQIAKILGKPYLALPVPLVKLGLAVGKRLGLTGYGPEQVNFLRYRPVLDNRSLKEDFGYTPRKTSLETFEYYLAAKKGT